MQYTGRSSLRKPEDGEDQEINDLNYNSDRIDSYAMGAFPCTSTTRPTGADRWDGMLIKETDTKLILQYDAAGAKWLPIKEQGRSFEPTTLVLGPTTAEALFQVAGPATAVFSVADLEVGAKYKFEWRWVQAASTAGDRLNGRVRYTEGATVPADPTIASAIFLDHTWGAPATPNVNYTQSFWKNFVAAQPFMKFVFSLLVAGGAGTTTGANGAFIQANIIKL